MLKELYCALKEEVIMGSFLGQILPAEDEPRPKKKKTISTKPKGCKDIRNSFLNAGRPRNNKGSIVIN